MVTKQVSLLDWNWDVSISSIGLGVATAAARQTGELTKSKSMFNLTAVLVLLCRPVHARTGVDIMVRSGFREYDVKNCVLLPAAGRRTQLFILLFSEPGVCGVAYPCRIDQLLGKEGSKEWGQM